MQKRSVKARLQVEMFTTQALLRLYVGAAVLAFVSASCQETVSCPCGSYGKNYTFCNDALLATEAACRTWSKCLRCKDGVDHCLECPVGLDGLTCSENTQDYDFMYCGNPGTFHNGSVRSLDERRGGQPINEGVDTLPDDEYPQGTRLQYTCKKGYVLRGEAVITCEDTGFWSADAPTCIVRDFQMRDMMYCANPGPIPNGRFFTQSSQRPRLLLTATVGGTKYPQGTQLRYSCEDGYTLHGDRIILCEKTGVWSTEMPSCIVECGRSFLPKKESFIVGSYADQTPVGEWPWTVAVATIYKNHSSVICGGVLLNRHTILTAAHCFDRPATFQLFFGKHKRRMADDDDRVQSRTRLVIKIHPNYNSSTYGNDIALVRFSPEIQFSVRIWPICLPSINSTAKNLLRFKMGIVTGWGLTENYLPAESLLMVRMPVHPVGHCIEVYRSRGVEMPITANKFCAGFENGRTNVCSGDSGSPMVFPDRYYRQYTLEGLVSFGPSHDCGMPGKYTFFTKVLPYMPWILRNMRNKTAQ